MSYFKDLSQYTYSDWDDDNLQPLNIGWLDKDFEFTSGNVSKEFISKLNELGVNLTNYCFGQHSCQFCSNYDEGNGELHIKGEGNIVYVAPEMILHYVVEHNYLPPEEFINAVMKAK